jgi:N-carbamoylputrescine amidase
MYLLLKMSMKVATLQFSMSKNFGTNADRAERMVRNAAATGANVIVLPELFESRYFCQKMDPAFFSWAETVQDSCVVSRFSALAGELGVVIPIPFFEKRDNEYYNSCAVADADGEILGVYRKTHVPMGKCYEEKFYFTPSRDGYKVFDTKFGKIGVAICWDQWFPEVARSLALAGADLIVYPTAIGSEPEFPDGETYAHWMRTIQGHSAANGVPIVVANRIGKEKKIEFYGGSFITDNKGAIVSQVGGDPKNGNADPSPIPMKGHVTFEFDQIDYRIFRAYWGIFRDRRPETYTSLCV